MDLNVIIGIAVMVILALSFASLFGIDLILLVFSDWRIAVPILVVLVVCALIATRLLFLH